MKFDCKNFLYFEINPTMTEKNIEIDPTKDQNLIVKYSFES